jgi:4-amino-4-deoxy-L-arabinose transferase-like glycosyltransferase
VRDAGAASAASAPVGELTWDQRAFLVVLGVGLALRLVFLAGTTSTGLEIVDEQHYAQLARSLVAGHGFAFAPGQPTSIRPPLYPVFVAGVWALSGTDSLQAVRACQIGLSVLTALLLYWLARRLFDARVALLAGAGVLLYPSLVVYDYLLLSEVLFTLLLTAFVALCVRSLETGRPSWAVAAGAALGLAALTRSILWLFPLMAGPLVYCVVEGRRSRRLAVAAGLLLGYAAVVTPWAIRNTRLQGTFTVVDTMGGLNLRMGNYEHTPLDRPWDAVSLTGEKSWAHELRQEHPDVSTWSEGRKEKWATRKALGYMAAHPGVTLKRAVIKWADFWGIEREYIAALQHGLYRPPAWFRWSATFAIAGAYVVLVVLASLGVFLAPPGDRRVQWLFLMLIGFVSGLHAIVFGHSRYHVPLVPLLLLYASAAAARRTWGRLGRLPIAAGPVLAVGMFMAIWAREMFVRDAGRIAELLRGTQ